MEIDPPTNDLLAQIVEGMTVLDATGEKVGSVTFVKMADLNDPDGSPKQPQADGGFLDRTVDRDEDDDDFLDALIGGDDVTKRMRRSGYMKNNTAGLFADDTYVVPRQIASVDEHVRLIERKEDLGQPR